MKEQSMDALHSSCIGQESFSKIKGRYIDKLYTPNYFIRIALGLLTMVAVWFSGLLLFMITGIFSSGGIMMLFIVLAIICYVALELLVKSKRFFNAGVDNVLLFYTVVLIIGAFFANDFATDIKTISAVSMFVCIWLAHRFADAFAAMLAYASFFILLFLVYIKFGGIAESTAPFVMASVSVFVYFQMQNFIRKEGLLYYRWCFKAVRLLTMFSFYASLNYFVVRELNSKMFAVEYSNIHPFSFGWIFWICTISIPIAYVAYGILKKDFHFIRTGLLLIAISVFTVRYYHPILPVEIAMFIAGVILIGISYALIRYLRVAKFGYTFTKVHRSDRELQLEGLIIAQTMGQKHVSGDPDANISFGGGSGGGGGAGGDY